MANRPLLDRLAGLETEYAIRLPRAASNPPTRFQLYQELVRALRASIVTVRARHFKEGIFTANGGAVWFEAECPASGAGLIEGSTPECRGPRQLVTYQRAQDRMLAATAATVPFRLVKNDRDAEGNTYGAQENYEATIGQGLDLFLWRVGLLALVPVLAATWLGLLGLIVAMLAYLALAGLAFLPVRLAMRDWRRHAVHWFGRDVVEGRETGGQTPPWLERLVLNATRVVTAPLAVALWLLVWLVAFRRTRRRLTAFLVSRPILAGSGMLDHGGQFWLADKASSINCVIGYGGFAWDRPVYTFGHFFKALCVEVLLSPRDFLELFAARQRLQIAIGDSNMADVAEYLRVATTMLVLDAIEAGELSAAPTVRHPIRALHAICRDPSLNAQVELSRGEATAIQIQRAYLGACRRFVERRPDAPREAYEILRLWEETLDGLGESRDSSAAAPLVGVLDWVTKKYLLDQAGPDLNWEARKKIDLRYHELSSEGYFQRMAAAGLARVVVKADECERAKRLPPPDSPATARGHFIREFTQGDAPIQANWREVRIGEGRRARLIRLSRYGSRRTQPIPPRRTRNETDRTIDPP